MPKVFGDIVTTPAVTIEMMSPDQVAPFEGDGPEAATALPAAAKNRNRQPNNEHISGFCHLKCLLMIKIISLYENI